MKNILSRFGKISLLLALMYFVVSCDDDKEDVTPGLYVMSDEIEAREIEEEEKSRKCGSDVNDYFFFF